MSAERVEHPWSIIDEVVASSRGAAAEDLASSLSAALSRLSAEQRLSIWRHYQHCVWSCYSHELVGAAEIMCRGGLSEDGFVYWRQWFVMQGRTLFEGVASHADEALADYCELLEIPGMQTDEIWDMCNGECLTYAFSRVMGDLPDHSFVDERVRAGLSGTPFRNAAEWRARYPRLLELFGD